MTRADVPVVAAADWGTSRLRIWLMDEHGGVVSERRTEEGLAAAQAAGFEAVLEKNLQLMNAPPGLPAIICGMAGSRQGWIDAPYVATPAGLAGLVNGMVMAPAENRVVGIIPGVAQRVGGRSEVMRGEETQLLGIATELGGGSHLVCMPGTHSKWVECGNGTVTELTTYMTGELFALLSRQSILRHSMNDGDIAVDLIAPAFRNAVLEALAGPARVQQRFFSIRAAALLDGLSAADAIATLSGLLIGAEIATATNNSSAGNSEIVLLASGELAQAYSAAIDVAGRKHRVLDAEKAVRTGLFEAARQSGLITADVKVRA